MGIKKDKSVRMYCISGNLFSVCTMMDRILMISITFTSLCMYEYFVVRTKKEKTPIFTKKKRGVKALAESSAKNTSFFTYSLRRNVLGVLRDYGGCSSYSRDPGWWFKCMLITTYFK